MGGKHKQSQRTKGNVKPSSSGRSAALLGNVSLTGFPGMKDCNSLFPAFHPGNVSDDLDPNVDANFHLVLKKMSKKDSTTRLKALQEFCKLVADTDIEVVKAVLPFWPRLYCVLAGDVDHRVREAAHQAQKSIVVRTKRNMAPFLRQVAGPWFTAQFDTYAPAASAASSAFQDAFPPNKLIEAVVFCQEEIMKYICDGLLEQNSPSAGNSQDTMARTDKQERVIVACLQGYAHLLHVLPGDALSNATFLEVSKKIMESKQFWELINDKTPVVRSAWLVALIAILEKMPQLLAEQHRQVVKSVVGRLTDVDPIVIPRVWQATLQILVTFDDWQEFCKLDKQVLPQLLSLLREGAHGCAAHVLPNLLPLLSCLLSKLPDQKTITNIIFVSLREGFAKRSVLNSHSNSVAVARCYMDCIRYAAAHGILTSNMVEEHVIPVVELAFGNTKCSVIAKAIFDELSLLLLYWINHIQVSVNNEMYQNFWDQLPGFFTNLLAKFPHMGDTDKTYVLNQQVNLCLSFKNPGRLSKKSLHRVRFSSGGEEKEEEKSEKRSSETTTVASVECERHSQKIVEFVQKVCVIYLQEMEQRNDMRYVSPLSELVHAFSSKEIFDSLTKSWNLVDRFIILQKNFLQNAKQEVSLFVNFAIPLIAHMHIEEREQILNNMCQEPEILACILLAAQRRETPLYTLEWLRSENMNKVYVSLSQNLSSKQNTVVLMKCAATAFDGGFLVNVHAVSLVLSELCKKSEDIDVACFAAQFLSAVSDSLFKMENRNMHGEDEALAANVYQLVKVLFRLCCQKEVVVASKSEDKTNALFLGWQQGLCILSSIETTDLKALVSTLSEIVKEKLIQRKLPFEEELEDIVKNVVNLLKAVSVRSDITELCSVFLDGFLPEYNMWQQQLKELCEEVEAVMGAPKSYFKTHKPLTVIETVNYIIMSQFTTMLIYQLCKCQEEENNDIVDETNSVPDRHTTECDQNGSSKSVQIGSVEEENISEDNKDTAESSTMLNVDVAIADTDVSQTLCAQQESTESSDPKNKDEEGKSSCQFVNISCLEEKILNVALAVSLCELFHEHLRSYVYYNNMKPHINELKKRFAGLVELLDSAGQTSYILNLAVHKAREDGHSWVKAAFHFGQEHCETVFSAVVCDKSFAYAARALLENAKKNSLKIPLCFLEDPPSYTTAALWLSHIQVPNHEAAVLSVITNAISEWQQLHHEDLLHDCDVSVRQWEDVRKVATKIHFLSACVKKCPALLNQQTWDFIIISTAYYSQSLKHSLRYFFCTNCSDCMINAWSIESIALRNVLVFGFAVFDLIHSITEFCNKVDEKKVSIENTSTNFEDIANEWREVFATDIHLMLFNIYISASEHIDHRVTVSLFGHLMTAKYASVLISVGLKRVFHQDSSQELQKKILKASCNLIHSSISSLQLAAYHILKECVSSLVEVDTVLVNNQGAEESPSESLKFEILPILDAVQNVQSVVDTMLAEFSFGDSCVVQPHTDTYYYSTAYFLLWDLILVSCGKASSELRYQYATLLRSLGYLPNVLNNLFCLMPAEVLEEEISKNKFSALVSMFSEPPSTALNNLSTCKNLQHWACWIYYSVLGLLPALVRQWWSDTKPKVSSMVQKATVQFVTPTLCTRQLQAIQNQNTDFKNMEVKVHSKAREVVALYAVDEAHMELVITLPETYPLGTIQVDSHTSLVGTSHWRNWVKQLSIFLTHQNGSLWDGLLLWKSNLDKRFEGVEECYICFSILHGTNFQIPKLCCKTCKKKFHSPCLYKWFSTSNKSTCPICRNIF